jgi:hypothetical protein
MASLNELQQDLDYVAGAVRRNASRPRPRIYLLWAVLLPVGFCINDFAPLHSGLYWLIASPLGVFLSFRLARADAERDGVRDEDRASRAGWHWLTVLAAYFLFGAALASGHGDWRSAAPTWMLIAALGNTLAGIHLSRELLWTGVVLFLGYAVLVWLPVPHIWTAIGLILGAGLAAAAIRGWGAREG